MSYTASAHPMLRVRSGRRGFRQRMRSGQTLVIFALSFTVLLGMAGLVIDVGRAYDLYARMQRAAEAGALAGVLYMPNYYNAVRPGDIDSAVSRASKEVVKNGYGTVLAPTTSACVAGAPVSICPVSGNQYDLQVTITQTLDLVLLSGLGVQPVTLIATAQADYLPPAPIGARTNYFGDKVECNVSGIIQGCDPNDGTNPHLQSFLASFIGPDDLKENGDPYVYCEEGAAYTSTLDGSSNSYMTYNGVGTNHPQYPPTSISNHCGEPTGATPGNPDQQPAGYSGPETQPTAHPGGYNYLVTVPSGVGNADIWVYNPSFIPCDSSCGYANFDHFIGTAANSNYYMGPLGNGILGARHNGFPGFNGINYDAPPFYYDITYSLYQVNSLYDRSSDVQIQAPSLVYPPYDAMSGDLSLHGCPGGDVYDPYWNGGATNNQYNPPFLDGSGCFPSATGNPSPYGTTAKAPCWQQWCILYTSLPAGMYRLVIEATGLSSNVSNDYSSDTTSGYGEHEYALKVCPAGLPSPIACSNGASGSNPGLQIAAWNDMDVYFSSNLSTNTPNPSDPTTTCVTEASPDTPYTCLDLACIPTTYAGRTLSLQIFDPGDGGGDIYVGVAEAGVGTGAVTYPGFPTTPVDGDSVVQAHFSSPNSYNALNGIWLTATITLPSTYIGDCQPSGTGWWQMIYASNNGTPNDTVGMKISLAGSPVHLVPPS